MPAAMSEPARDDLTCEIFGRQGVDRGIADADACRMVSLEEAERRLGLNR
jgi:predicted transcriptional regulator